MPEPIRSPSEGVPGTTVVVMPAYNAGRTLDRVVREIPAGCYDRILVVDDASRDDTVEVARDLGLEVVRHPENRGYGGNQKTCYRLALEMGADYVVMLHPDFQYDGRIIPAALQVMACGACDVVLGNRIRTRREALEGGMPIAKYAANRGLTLLENLLTGQNLGEWHSGFRAYRRAVLESIPFERNSDDFVFDSQFLLQCVHWGFKVGDVPMPVRYLEEASSIGYGSAAKYAVETLGAFAVWFLHRSGLRSSRLFGDGAAAGTTGEGTP